MEETRRRTGRAAMMQMYSGRGKLKKHTGAVQVALALDSGAVLFPVALIVRTEVSNRLGGQMRR